MCTSLPIHHSYLLPTYYVHSLLFIVSMSRTIKNDAHCDLHTHSTSVQLLQTHIPSFADCIISLCQFKTQGQGGVALVKQAQDPEFSSIPSNTK
jgi:hypothetical protein